MVTATMMTAIIVTAIIVTAKIIVTANTHVSTQFIDAVYGYPE